ncbi:MAG: TlyA family RNA methyltransferase [Myxococcales bacterium]|nr:TlyA family RNA methyltransferase [Myxococcales bacterium]
MNQRERVDALLVLRGLAETRTKAQALILAGQVTSDTRRLDKPGMVIAVDAPLIVATPPRFVSRGGDKLVHALEVFLSCGLCVSGKVCVDIGASTGGFSDCLLQHGVRKIYAVDVGWGQLHERLRCDERIVVRERTNARHLERGDFDDGVDVIVVDASFIGIGKLLGAVARILSGGGELVCLVKPQFEVGRSEASRTRGVVRDPAIRARAIDQVKSEIAAAGFNIIAGTDSPVAGPKGNVEHFVYARRQA